MKSQKQRFIDLKTDAELMKNFFITRILLEATNARELKQLVEWELNKYVCIKAQIRIGKIFQWYLGDCFQYRSLLVNSRLEALMSIAQYMGYKVYTDRSQSNIWITGKPASHFHLFTI